MFIIPTDFRASHDSLVMEVTAYELKVRGLFPAGARVFSFITQSKWNLESIPISFLPNDYWRSFLAVKAAGNVAVKNKLGYF
jgi:hypothetical protein